MMGWTNTPMQRMLFTYGELTTMAAPPRPEIALKPDQWLDATKNALEADEHDELWRQTQGITRDRNALAAHRLDSRPDNRESLRQETHGGRHQHRTEQRRDHRHGGQRRGQSRGHREERPDRSRRGDRRRENQARLLPVNADRVSDGRSALVGAADTRAWSGGGVDGRTLGPARLQVVLQDRETVLQLSQQRETVLQERVDVLTNDLSEERRHRKKAEDELTQIREFYDQFEPVLVPKTQATKDVEQADQIASDLHMEDLAELREQHNSHVIAMESEFDEL